MNHQSREHEKITTVGAWAAGASCLFCSIWNVLRRLTACLVAFVVSIPFGAQSSLYGLLSWLFACVEDLFCTIIAAYGAFIGHV